MARKKSGSFGMIALAIGGYFLYKNWPAVSAWMPAITAPPAAVPASAGTIVSTAALAPVIASTPAAPPAVPASAGTIVSTVPAAAPVLPTSPKPAPSYVLSAPSPLAHVVGQESMPVKNTAQIQAQITELQQELAQATNANGYTNQDRQDLHQEIAALTAQL